MEEIRQSVRATRENSRIDQLVGKVEERDTRYGVGRDGWQVFLFSNFKLVCLSNVYSGFISSQFSQIGSPCWIHLYENIETRLSGIHTKIWTSFRAINNDLQPKTAGVEGADFEEPKRIMLSRRNFFPCRINIVFISYPRVMSSFEEKNQNNEYHLHKCYYFDKNVLSESGVYRVLLERKRKVSKPCLNYKFEASAPMVHRLVLPYADNKQLRTSSICRLSPSWDTIFFLPLKWNWGDGILCTRCRGISSWYKEANVRSIQ